MIRKERSRSRSQSGFRKHIRTTSSLIKKNILSSDSEDESSHIIKRNRYTLTKKKNFVERYKEIKKYYPKKGLQTIANELHIPRNCLKEWLKQIEYIENTPCKSTRKNLEGGGRYPETIEIEDTFIKWVAEQRKLENPISTNEIIYKVIELDKKQKDKKLTFLIWTRHTYILKWLQKYVLLK